MTTRLIDDRLFASSDPLALCGARCSACGTTTFPAQDTCPRCFAQEMRDQPLPTTGSVWSWTVQHFAPKPPYRPPPTGFVPYLLGYVDLGSLVVESRLTGSVDHPPVIGDQVELVALPVFVDEDGTDVVTFAFEATRVTPPGYRHE